VHGGTLNRVCLQRRSPGDSKTESLHPDIREAIRRALREDIGAGDVTSERIIPAEATMHGRILTKQRGVVAGLDVAAAVYAEVDASIQVEAEVEEGGRVAAGQSLATASGPARGLLTGERTALNFLGRMSGIATLTREFVDAIAGTRAQILDTRKTAPGLRMLDKLAVRRGGGKNHRSGLYDMMLIKDNHVDFARGIAEAVRRARAAGNDIEIEVEARTLEDVSEALRLDVRRILLDNMSTDSMQQAVEMTSGRAKLEASGNVSLQNVREIAETGVDYISVGALTHSAATLDVSFDYLK
jgi:nicotinate-nucleotide pyrophosphorylase (carboxylating)